MVIALSFRYFPRNAFCRGHLLKLERKIVLSFVFLAVLLIGVGIVWELYYSGLNKKQLAESEATNEIVDLTNSMEIDLYQTLIYLNLIHESRLSKGTDIDVRNIPLTSKTLENFNTNFTAFYDSLGQIEEVIINKSQLVAEVEELSKKVKLYESISREWLQMGDTNEESHIMFLSSIAPYFLNNIVPNFEEIRDLILYDQELTIQGLNEQIERGRIINYSVTGLILIIGVLIGIYLYRSIINPLQELVLSVNKLGGGNLKHRTKITSGDEFGYVGNAINEMAENLEKQTISSSYLDNVMESITEGIFVVDDEGIVHRLNEAGADLLEMNKDELIGKCIYEYVNLIDLVDNKDSRNKEYQLQTLNDSRVPVLFSESDLMNSNTKIGTVLVVRDISELKKVENELRDSLREKDVMMAEIHHRVKNNLAVISGLLQLQTVKSTDKEVNKALMDSQLRIQSIALIHEKLYGNDSLASISYEQYLKDLLDSIQKTYVNDVQEIEVVTDVKNIALNVNQAIPCSLLINEVIVNAYKHAFNGQDRGVIKISMYEEDKWIQIIIEDNGKGFSQDGNLNTSSLGSTLIQTLTNQLGGISSQKNNENKPGTIFKLNFPKKG